MIAGFLASLFTLWSWAAEPGTEFVIVLDNSCSMAERYRRAGEPGWLEPRDPQRRGVLGAMMVAGLAQGSDDRVTVLGFPARNGKLFESSDPSQIRTMPIVVGTKFEKPLKRARGLLDQSPKQDRMLVFLSDGEPTDLKDPARGRAILGLDDDPAFETLVVGLFPGENPEAEAFLQALARRSSDYVRVERGTDLIENFTFAVARLQGAKALTGTLAPGQPRTFEVGPYVSEVLAMVSSLEPGNPLQARLERGETEVAPNSAGDNGCERGTRRNPDLCKPPRMHYATWRAHNDSKSVWSLSTQDPAAFGVVLRYAFQVQLDTPPTAKIGEPANIEAHLVLNERAFDDPSFFSQDGFEAFATIGDREVPMEHLGDGIFRAPWTPQVVGTTPVEVRFSNNWMERRERARVDVYADAPLSLTSQVPELDFGRWSGERTSTERCVDLTVESSRPLDDDTLSYSFEGAPSDLTLSVVPEGQTLHACARAKGCCGDISTDGTFLKITARANGEQAALGLPVRAVVDRTGFLRCWWPWLLALLALLVLLIILYGFIRPHDFDEDLTVKIGGSERQLNRAASLVLREQPGGRRGFYRNARIALTGAGDFVRNPRNAAVWIEATGSGETRIHLMSTVETQDRRTRKWVPLTEEQAEDGVRLHTLYRVGDILFRFS